MSVVGSKYKRFNFRVNADYDVFKWLTIGVTSSLVKSSNLAASSGLNTHITRPPYGLAYDDDGNILQYINSSGDKNPLYDAQYEKEQTDANIIRLNGYIQMDHDGFITLTHSGKAIADKIYERHRLLSSWLEQLGVDPKVAAEDACRMEHVISSESFEAIKRHTHLMEEKLQSGEKDS